MKVEDKENYVTHVTSGIVKIRVFCKKEIMGLLDLLFGNRRKKINTYLKKSAIILDVRTKREYSSGAIKNSKHIPLQELHSRFKELDVNNSYIVVCASGVRSAKATKFLNLNNIDAINGGGWQNLNRIIDN